MTGVYPTLRARNRQAAQDMVLDAAERLLRTSDTADFSMRALAAEAGVGFATPFNHFGSKTAIMQALSARLIDRMAERFGSSAPAGDAVDRVLAMGAIAVALLLEQPDVHKAVVGSLSVVSPVPCSVITQSRALWALALGDLDGIAHDLRETARGVLPHHLAIGFRGCLSFWIAGEFENEALRSVVDTEARTMLLGFADPRRRPFILSRIAVTGSD